MKLARHRPAGDLMSETSRPGRVSTRKKRPPSHLRTPSPEAIPLSRQTKRQRPEASSEVLPAKRPCLPAANADVSGELRRSIHSLPGYKAPRKPASCKCSLILRLCSLSPPVARVCRPPSSVRMNTCNLVILYRCVGSAGCQQFLVRNSCLANSGKPIPRNIVVGVRVHTTEFRRMHVFV